MTLLPEKELNAVEEWFAELLTELGFSSKTDRGRVLAGVRKLKQENEEFEKEKKLVAKEFGYSRWGDLVNYCSERAGVTPEVELPELYNDPPHGWILKEGGLTYDGACKRLTKTQKLLKEAFASIEKDIINNPDGWEEEVKSQVAEVYRESNDPDDFEAICYRFIHNIPEYDPEEDWFEVADRAAELFETYPERPRQTLEDLIAYARDNAVEINAKGWEIIKSSVRPESQVFYYLLTSCYASNNRPTSEEQMKAMEVWRNASDYWEDYEKAKGVGTVFNEETTLDQIVLAMKTMEEMEATSYGKTHNDRMERIVEVMTQKVR